MDEPMRLGHQYFFPNLKKHILRRCWSGVEQGQQMDRFTERKISCEGE
jgi:hypothetical protein